MGSMGAIWPYFFFSLIAAWLSKRNDRYALIDEMFVRVRRDRFFFFITALTMSVFVGLRLWCNDTGTYLEIYTYLTPSDGSVFDIPSWSIGDNPGFLILNRIFKHFHVSNQNYLMLISIITNFIYLWFVKKYSKRFVLSVFLLWTMGAYLFTAAAIKQTLATALGLLGIDAFLEKKYVKFAVFVLLGVSIHPYVVMFFIAPLLVFPPWTRNTYRLLGIFAVAGLLLQVLLRFIVNITSMLGETFTTASFSGEGVNVFRLAVVWAPVFLSWYNKEKMRNNEDENSNLFMNFTMLNAEIMFVALFGTANYFARLANYFLIFQSISIPWILDYISQKNKKIMNVIIVVCYSAYFYAANAVLTPFNTYFAKMSLWSYLGTLLGG